MIGGARCIAGLDVGSTTTSAVLIEVGPAWEGAADTVRVLGVGTAHTEGA